MSNDQLQTSDGIKEKLTAKWIDILKKDGRSCLQAKINSGLKINGEEANPKNYTDFILSTFQGFPKRQFYDDLNGCDVAINMAQMDISEDIARANYLVTGLQFASDSSLGKILGIESKGDYAPVRYYSWSHANFTRDARGHHTPVTWMLYLPAEKLTDFMSDFTNNPQALDGLFKQMHSGFISDEGMQRLKVNRIRIIEDLPKQSKEDVTKILKYKKWIEKELIMPIGERD